MPVHDELLARVEYLHERQVALVLLRHGHVHILHTQNNKIIYKLRWDTPVMWIRSQIGSVQVKIEKLEATGGRQQFTIQRLKCPVLWIRNDLFRIRTKL